MTFIIGPLQFHCKSEHKQLKWNKIRQEMCKSASIFPYLQISTLFFKILKSITILKFISWKGWSEKWTRRTPKEKCI